MIRSLSLALCLAATALSAQAMPAPSQLALEVANELPSYGYAIDVSALNTVQLAALHHILFANYGTGTKRALIASALGGPNTLRGLLFGNR